ncbi:MAG: hypothetical protein MUF45_13520 [Spirosomaceae bacterium]|jgi:hypothetical protein|nr:hypothetical protein [Spirosomataceae bacterium]
MEVLVEIPERKMKFFTELVSQLGFKIHKKEKQLSENEIFEGINESWEEIKLHQEGKVKLPLAKDILHEL